MSVSLRTLLSRHHALFSRWLSLGGIVSAALVVLTALLFHAGDWVSQQFLLFYIAPLFLYGALWARDRLGRFIAGADLLFPLDALAFIAGALRVTGGWGVLPYSGHMLFLTYAALVPGSRVLRVLAVVLLAMTTVFKLVLWHDPRSWSLGIAAGLVLAGVRVSCVLLSPRAFHD